MTRICGPLALAALLLTWARVVGLIVLKGATRTVKSQSGLGRTRTASRGLRVRPETAGTHAAVGLPPAERSEDL
jgi:hypothetical protein